MAGVFTIRFGTDGNAQEFLGEGWSPSEPGFTWTMGQKTTLSLPRPPAGNGLLISLRAHPLLVGPHPHQRVTASIAGDVIGKMVFTEPDDFRLFVAASEMPNGDKLELTLALPDAARPSDYHAVSDDRMLGLCCFHLTAEPISREQEHPVSLATIAAGMESLGRNCEFGLVQRQAGAEPLGLLRFATSPLHSLTAALDARFEGLGAPQHTEIIEIGAEGQLPEWVVVDRRFGFVFHTWAMPGDVSRAEIEAREARRLPFLVRKLLEDLELAEKLFVYQAVDLTSPDQALPLWDALRRYGRNDLLVVVAGAARAGQVVMREPGFLVGFISRLTELADAKSMIWSEWVQIMRNAYELRHPG